MDNIIIGVITPTIPSRSALLLRCINSITSQTLISCKRKFEFKHFIGGDNWLPPTYPHQHVISEKVINTGKWGGGVRNILIEKYNKEVDYFIFVNDDDIFLPSVMNKITITIGNDRPDFVIWKVQEIQHSAKSRLGIFPKTWTSIHRGSISDKNFAIKANLAAKYKWIEHEYAADWFFFEECLRDGDTTSSINELLSNKSRVKFIDEVLGLWCRGC
jgi:hypothetical protein